MEIIIRKAILKDAKHRKEKNQFKSEIPIAIGTVSKKNPNTHPKLDTISSVTLRKSLGLTGELNPSTNPSD